MNRPFPLASETTSSSSPDALSNTSPPAPRILVVDDDSLLCGLHALLLEQHGYDTVTAGNGQDALTQLASGDFDLVVTDSAMPVLDGQSMILALRSAGSRIPVIMISGTLALTPLPAVVAREVSVALLKPAHPKEILAAVRMALTTSPLAKRPKPYVDAQPVAATAGSSRLNN